MKNTVKDLFIHESCFIDDHCEIGEGTKIWHFCHVRANASIGKKCILGQSVYVGDNVKIGNHVKIQNNVSVYEGVILEDDVFCGPSMVFTNVINPRANISRRDEFKGTIVRQGATIGANATILCGHTLGKYSFIGAGAVVTKDVPAYALMVGNPAKRIGWMCECGIKINESLKCSTCQLAYKTTKEGIAPENER